MMQQRVREIAQGLATVYGVEFDLQLEQGGYWPVNNDPDITREFIQYMANDDEVDLDRKSTRLNSSHVD